MDTKYRILKIPPSTGKPEQRAWEVTSMQAHQVPSVKIRKLAFGKKSVTDCSGDIILALEKEKE